MVVAQSVSARIVYSSVDLTGISISTSHRGPVCGSYTLRRTAGGAITVQCFHPPTANRPSTATAYGFGVGRSSSFLMFARMYRIDTGRGWPFWSSFTNSALAFGSGALCGRIFHSTSRSSILMIGVSSFLWSLKQSGSSLVTFVFGVWNGDGRVL